MLIHVAGTQHTLKSEYFPHGLFIQASQVIGIRAQWEEVERVDSETLIWQILSTGPEGIKVSDYLDVRLSLKEGHWEVSTRTPEGAWESTDLPQFVAEWRHPKVVSRSEIDHTQNAAG